MSLYFFLDQDDDNDAVGMEGALGMIHHPSDTISLD